MPVERRRRTDSHASAFPGYLIDNARQIAFEMNAQGEEVGDHQDVVDTLSDQRFDRALQARRAQFQKGGLDGFEPSGGGQLVGDGAYGLVGRFEARSVGEYDDSSGQVR